MAVLVFCVPDVVVLGGRINLSCILLSSVLYLSSICKQYLCVRAFAFFSKINSKLQAIVLFCPSSIWRCSRLCISICDIYLLPGADTNIEAISISIWGTRQVLWRTTTPLRARSSRQQVYTQWQYNYKSIFTRLSSDKFDSRSRSAFLCVLLLPVLCILFADDEPEDRHPPPVGDDPESDAVSAYRTLCVRIKAEMWGCSIFAPSFWAVVWIRLWPFTRLHRCTCQ